MIKRLQRKFVLIAAICLLIVETLIIGSINIINVYQINIEEDQLLDIISEHDGKFPEFSNRGKEDSPPPENVEPDYQDKKKPLNEETRYQTRYFSVSCNSSGETLRVDTGHIAAVTSEQAVSYAEQAAISQKNRGYIGNYKYLISERENGGKLYVFLDCQKDSDTKSRFMLISLSIAATGYVLVCVMIIIFSKRAVRPVIQAFEKQRQFITDAGHEIKTPLAIISANTEVIEMTSEPSEWTSSIRNQIDRLNGLIANLLKLSRMEEDNVKLTFCEFDLSEAFEDTVAPFETLAETKGKKLKTDIEKGIRFNGDEGAIRQLISILVENAVKYADEKGVIKAELYKSANGKSIKFKVTNTCADPPQGDLNRLFDRFYREDSSHSRSEGESKSGYGIGLSIAKAVCEAHKGKILCKAEKGEIVFTAVFRI